MKPAWERLNPEQRSAAVHEDGPALVVAGPGTGKTTTLVARYAYLVQALGIHPQRIFTTSFTRRAARQLRDRLGRAGITLPRRAPVGTFHALCLQILQARGARFEILEEGKSRALLDEVQRGPGERLRLDELRAFKTQLLSPDDVHAGAKDSKARQLAEAYRAYEAAKSERGAVDYEDLLGRVVELYREDESDLPRFDYLMVDEYQDLNAAQDVLIAALRGEHTNVWAVGDDDQAIYGFRGSDTRFITDFERTYPGAKVITLREHYRTPSKLLERSST
ncbi:MAG: UvrD-helicase domain-containing protein, partial [Myxococcota bacterium]